MKFSSSKAAAGTAVVLSDIYLYYARKFADKNSLDESKSYLETAIKFLEDIYQVIKEGNNDDFFETSFSPVLSRAESLMNDIDSIYSTKSWKARLDSLKVNY